MTVTKQTGEKGSEKRSLYFKDPFMDLMFLHTLTLHGFKGSELGECYSAAAQIREEDLETYKLAWNSLAEQVEAIARDAEAKGHRVSARQAYLRAVTYLRNAALALQPSDPRYRPTIEKSRVLFRKFAALSTPAIEVVEIPYEWTSLPGYFLRPDVSGQKRPTIVIGDNTSEELYYWVGPPAVERGYNALLVDLPGIGLNHFNGIRSRADTEVPVKAVIDYLCSRGDVDPAPYCRLWGRRGRGIHHDSCGGSRAPHRGVRGRSACLRYGANRALIHGSRAPHIWEQRFVGRDCWRAPQADMGLHGS